MSVRHKKTYQNDKNKQYSGIFLVYNYGRSHFLCSFSLHLNKKGTNRKKGKKWLEIDFLCSSWTKAKKCSEHGLWPLSFLLFESIIKTTLLLRSSKLLFFLFVLIRDFFQKTFCLLKVPEKFYNNFEVILKRFLCNF